MHHYWLSNFPADHSVEQTSSHPFHTTPYPYETLYQSFPPTLQLVFAGHEYTVSNLTYAQHVEPTSTAIQERMVWAKVRL